MNILNTFLIFAVAFLAVFGEAALPGLRHLFGAQVDLLPVLMVYAALNASLSTIAALAIFGRVVVRRAFGESAGCHHSAVVRRRLRHFFAT